MADDILVQVENVSKKYCRDLKRALWYGVRDVAREVFGLGAQEQELRRGEFWAVDDVSFEVRRGECLGLIGRNGAGKSTLLKLLNGLVKPDRGSIRMRGRVGALIELGTGFNPILTGRENIYNNAAVLGISKREVDKRLEEIIDFAELDGTAIDAPVQSYSSGMKVRLGFAVAAHLEPDVLLIDEVLAVGDQAFKNKCLRRLRDLLSSERAVLFVSHSMPQVQNICDRAVLLDCGKAVFEGPVQEVVALYYEQTTRSIEADEAKLPSHGVPHIYSTGQVEYLGGCCVDEHRRCCTEIEPGGRTTIRIELAVRKPVERAHFQLFVHAECPGNSIAFASTELEHPLGVGTHVVEFALDRMPFTPGLYYVGSRMSNGDVLQKLVYSDNVFRFRIRPVADGLKTNKPGYFHLHGGWQARPRDVLSQTA